jgi:ketosteroid isomerase-like protein
MSRENLNLVRGAYEAWNREDLEWGLRHVGPEFELHPMRGFFDLEGVYRGKDGYRRFWTTWREAWESITITVERIEAIGRDRVRGQVTFDAKGNESGADVSLKATHVFTIRNGRFARLETIPGWEAVDDSGPAKR